MVTVSSRWGGVIVTLAVASILAGCVDLEGHYDYDFTPVDAVGIWKSIDVSAPVTLEVNDDGTFLAREWPHEFYCDGAIPEAGTRARDLGSETVDYSGTWKLGGDDVDYVVSFLSDGPECRSNWSAVVRVMPGTPRRLEIEISPMTPEDEVTDDHRMRLSRQ